jgi:Fur family ferric uptake transcriptional regulator
MIQQQNQDTLLERMKVRGIRMTPQRVLIARLLENARDHLDADSVYNLARKKDAHIHRATVYRTLSTLKKLHLIDELDLMHVEGDRHFYEVRPSSLHIHLVCMACGKVAEPSGKFWESMKGKVFRETGFRPEVIRLEMGGKCESCQKTASKKKKTHSKNKKPE